MNKPLCIYHGNCADGFGAACAIAYRFGIDNVDWYAGVHNDPPPDVADRTVFMVDFAYKRPVLIEMAERARSILILDHHKSAEADLVDLPANVTAVFDIDRSGAMITWQYFNPDIPVPRLICHIEDRDLWRFNLPGTREIQAALFSYPYDFEIWLGLINAAGVHELYVQGEAIERKHHKDIAEFTEIGKQRMSIGGYDVPVLNMPYFFVSDAAHNMAEGEPFAACYWDTTEYRVFGLRSQKDGIDVSEIAIQFNGGGHKHAAGFRIPLGVQKPDDVLL